MCESIYIIYTEGRWQQLNTFRTRDSTAMLLRQSRPNLKATNGFASHSSKSNGGISSQHYESTNTYTPCSNPPTTMAIDVTVDDVHSSTMPLPFGQSIAKTLRLSRFPHFPDLILTNTGRDHHSFAMDQLDQISFQQYLSVVFHRNIFASIYAVLSRFQIFVSICISSGMSSTSPAVVHHISIYAADRIHILPPKPIPWPHMSLTQAAQVVYKTTLIVAYNRRDSLR